MTNDVPSPLFPLGNELPGFPAHEAAAKSACPACAIARVAPATGHFNHWCPECSARCLAHSPCFHDSMKQGTLTDTYRRAISYFFPNEDEAAVHQRVKGFAALLKGARHEA